jgi:phosphate transport system substrate-binding protein
MRNVILAALLAAAGTHGARAETVTGAGSTFIQPLMDRWTKAYEAEKKGTVRYEAVGSGRGVERLLKRAVDFACTEAPVSEKVLAKFKTSGKEVLHVPLVLGAVVPAYNLPGIKTRLKFSGPVLADVYLGKIKRWNDAALARLNPGVALPDREVVVVRRRDSSGTTFIWTSYLAKVSPQAKEKIGVSSLPNWTIGVALAGNDGVAGEVARTPGAIGYVEALYGALMEKNKKFRVGSVQNRAGEFVVGSPKAVAAALAGLKKVPADLRLNLTDQSGKGAYPIVGVTWALVYVKQKDKEKAKALADFLTWAIHEGQKSAPELLYVALPKGLVPVVEKRIQLIGAGP